MPDVLCDTSFMMHMAHSRIKNIESLDDQIGPVRFLAPDAVLRELEGLSSDLKKGAIASVALEKAKTMPTVSIGERGADSGLIRHVSENGGIVATLDRRLKEKIKKNGGMVVSVSNDRIMVES